MKKSLKVTCFLLLLFTCITVRSQEKYDEKEGFEGKNLTSMHADTEWYKMLQSEQKNIFEIQKAYNKYFLVNQFQKSKETREFEFWKRHIAEDNYDENGNVGKQIIIAEDVKILSKQQMQKSKAKTNVSNWTRIMIKPDMMPTWLSSSYTQGTCNMVAIHPTDSNQLIAAFIDGGTLWRTTDGGTTWTQCATNLLARHFGSVVYCKSNPLIVYAACKQGVIKSIDGGETWAFTPGLNNQASYPTGNEIWTMEVKADDPNVVICAYKEVTSNQIYKTTDGGQNWVQSSMLGASFRDIKSLPSNSNVLLATITTSAGPELRRSVDFGTTWSPVVGFPYVLSGYKGRLAMLATSDAEPNSVWVDNIMTNSTNSSLKGESVILKSIDGGLTFAKLCSADATVDGKLSDMSSSYWQSIWNQAFCVSNTDPTIMAGGAYNTLVTKDNGLTWYGDGSMGKTGPHSDVHCVVLRGKTLWMAGDGGLTRSYDFGRTYNHSVDDGIQSHCLWGFDQAWKSDVMAIGMYHGPTTLRDDNIYVGWYPGPGADASKAFINKSDDRFIYAHPWGNVKITRSASRMVQPTKTDITHLYSGKSDMNDPHYYEKLYGINSRNLMISNNNASSFSDSTIFEYDIMEYAPSFSDPSVAYVCCGWEVYKTADRGANWQNVSPNLSNLTHIAVDGVNPQVVWITSGYKRLTEKVFKSTDGGQTWVDYTATGLPSYAINCIVHQIGSDGGVYVGTDAGVYYRDNKLDSWVPYNNNLPLATHVNWIKINYAKAKIRIAGKTGIWESDLYEPSLPVAHPSTAFFESLVGKTFQFADMSACLANASYEWTFPDGTPASSTLERPTVQFNKGGDKEIILKVTDASGSDTRSYKSFVRVRSSTALPKTGWVVSYFDSQYNTTTNAASNAIDGNGGTIWVSKGSSTIKYPHDLQIDMGNAVAIEAFKYMPRSDGFTIGQVKGYEWYVSNDGVNWGAPVATGEFSSTVSEKVVQLSFPVAARYFRFRPLSSIDGSSIASAAEVGIIGSASLIAGFTADKTIITPGKLIAFQDKSAGNPTKWQWEFPGGTPASSTDQHPTVRYDVPGVYPVTLNVSNSEGGDCYSKSSYITVSTYVPRTGWTVKYVDSEETVSEKAPATNSFDEDIYSYWSSNWSTTTNTYPHELQIDMGAEYFIGGFTCYPRITSTKGRIANYEFYVSKDGENWTLAVKGTWPNTSTEKSQKFDGTSARYIKLVALSEVYGQNSASIADLKVKYGLEIASGVNKPVEIEDVFIYSYNNELKIEVHNQELCLVEIFDCMGHKISQAKVGKGLNSISLNPGGIFIVKVTNNNGSISRKIAIN